MLIILIIIKIHQFQLKIILLIIFLIISMHFIIHHFINLLFKFHFNTQNLFIIILIILS
jgi:hypothetical protein